ncbi:hypothetical protein K492DRAFT_193384 [Lichtheimia hyalospora FSU 10163]|nr:hypothetical protein K492DRAFT_193384 [Lichtheimia hyalospora FSU 10163]
MTINQKSNSVKSSESNGKVKLDKLSLEIVLYIQHFITDWNDKLNFAKLSEYTWYMSSKIRLSQPLKLESCEINTLQLLCACEIQLSDQHLPRHLLSLIIKYSYAVRKFFVPPSSSQHKRFAHWFMHQVSKRHDAVLLAIQVDYHHVSLWHEAAAKYGGTVNITATGIEQVGDECDADLFLTPLEAKRSKQMIKELYIRSGICPFGNANSSKDKNSDDGDMIPLSAVSLLEKGAKYERNTRATRHDLPSPTETIDLSTAHTLASDTGKKYLEMIVLFGSYWFMITSLDLFIHKSADIDDCADKTDRQYEIHPRAYIVSKSIHGKASYHELSICLANIELVAVGGFFGKDNHPEVTGFLGSSIKHLPVELRQPTSSTHILMRIKCAEHSTSNRHLRQYSKIAAPYMWSFHSLRFAIQDFYPINPLAFADHAATINGLGGISCRLASRFLQCVAKRHVCKSDIEDALFLASSDPRLKELISNMRPLSFKKTCKQVSSSHTISKFMKIVIDAMVLLEKELGKEDSVRLQNVPMLSETVLKILNTGYANRLTTANETAIKIYHSKYRFNFSSSALLV